MPILYGIALGLTGVRSASSQIVAIVGRHEKAPGWPGVVGSLGLKPCVAVVEGVEHGDDLIRFWGGGKELLTDGPAGSLVAEVGGPKV